MGDVRCETDEAERVEYDALDARMILAFARHGGAVLPPRRSYLWNLLRKSCARRIAAVAVTLGDGRPLMAAGLFERLEAAVAGPAAQIVAAEIFAAEVRPPERTPDGRLLTRAEIGFEAQRIGVIHGRAAIVHFLEVAPIVAGRVEPFCLTLPDGWQIVGGKERGTRSKE